MSGSPTSGVPLILLWKFAIFVSWLTIILKEKWKSIGLGAVCPIALN